MGWKKVKTEVLVKCRRYCCLCEKYSGKNIEVHHLIPKSKGGKDEVDNAIPLCFICHTEVGNYNTNHPKGNSYSIDELKIIRDLFYKKVERLPRCEECSDRDKELLAKFKNDYTDLIEYCCKIDFAAERVDMYLADRITCTNDEWKSYKNQFENDSLNMCKDEIIMLLDRLCTYLDISYFHAVDARSILFNCSSIQDGMRLEELRNATYEIRGELSKQLAILHTFR